KGREHQRDRLDVRRSRFPRSETHVHGNDGDGKRPADLPPDLAGDLLFRQPERPGLERRPALVAGFQHRFQGRHAGGSGFHGEEGFLPDVQSRLEPSDQGIQNGQQDHQADRQPDVFLEGVVRHQQVDEGGRQHDQDDVPEPSAEPLCHPGLLLPLPPAAASARHRTIIAMFPDVIRIVIAKKNIRPMAASAANTSTRLLPIIRRHATIGLSPRGCITAPDRLKMIASDKIFTAGNAHSSASMSSPAIPTAFLTRSDVPITASAASVNILPTTGTKLPVMYFAVRMVTPSATEAATPWTDRTPRNAVRSTPRMPVPIVRSRSASWLTLYFSDIELTMCRMAEKNRSGNTTAWTAWPTTLTMNTMSGCSTVTDARLPMEARSTSRSGTAAVMRSIIRPM